ncbi:MAG: T9SS type A sorting domain-containing protein [Adhaeribacter sp.]
MLGIFLLPGFARAQLSISNFEEARLVIGQSSFTAQSTAVNEVNTPAATAVALSGAGAMAVASQTPGRVLLWLSRPLSNGQPADVVVGKPDFTATAFTSPTAASMRDCAGVAFSPDGKKLLVADAFNNRVLIWNNLPTTNGQPADVVIGQTNFTDISAGTTANKLFYPAGLLVTPGGKLVVNDVLNHRVLIFNAIPTTNGAAADVILGQPGINSNATGTAANQMNRPWYSAVSPDGKLLVSDTNNHRVLVFNALPTSNGAAANGVIGQTGFNVNPSSGLAGNKLNSPLGLSVSQAGQLAVADYLNNRVLLFDSIPGSNGAAANVVLGQPNFSVNTENNGGITARSMASPTGVQHDFNGRVFVSERKGQGSSQSGRVLVFGNPTGSQADLGISSAATMALPCRDINLQYQVRLLNNGPNLATNVLTGLFLPAELSQAATSPVLSAGTWNAATGTWLLPTLNPGQAATLTFSGTVPAGFSGRVIRQNALIRSSDQTDPNLGNNASGTELTVIGALPPAPVANPVTICTGNDTTLTASGPGLIKWYDAATNGRELAQGPVLETGLLSTTTTYYVAAFNECISSVRTPVTVTVNQPIAGNTITGTQTVCQNQALATLSGSSPGGGNGNYQYQWQISTDNQTWQNVFNDARAWQKDLSPGGLSTTSWFRRRVIAGPCAYSYSNVIQVTVNALPSVSFSGLPAKVCTDTAPITLTGSPAGGTFSGPGVSGNVFNPATAGAGAHIISYRFTNGNQCSNTANIFVLVGPAVYGGGAQSACINTPAFALSGAIPAGGTWSGPGLTANGLFDPAVAGVGDHLLTYTVSGNFGCGQDPQTLSTTKTVQVRPLTVVNPGPAQTVCINQADFNLSGYSPANGTWSGPGVTAEGRFSPRTAGLGTHTLTFTANTNNCPNSATKTITVSPLPVLSLQPLDRQCSSNFLPVALSGGQPAGGTWSGPGVLNNRFTPSLAGVGTHTLTYTYTDASGCSSSATQPVIVEICTGLAEEEILKTLSLYPNPAQEALQLAFRMPAAGPLTVKLLSMSGQVVAQREMRRHSGLYEQRFNVEGLARGVYVLQLITDQAVVSKRVLLK